MSESLPPPNQDDEMSRKIDQIASTLGSTTEALHGEGSTTAHAELSVADIDAELIQALRERVDQFDELSETSGNCIRAFNAIELLMRRAAAANDHNLMNRYLAIIDRAVARCNAAGVVYPDALVQDILVTAMIAGSLDAEWRVHNELGQRHSRTLSPTQALQPL